MPLIRHHVVGHGQPVIVFVHGFGCAHDDWAAQVAALSGRYKTVAVDLPGHGDTPADPADCTIERYAAGVAELVGSLQDKAFVLVGHSMGCRVIVEAALQLSTDVAGMVLVDGSQFSPAMETVLRDAFAGPDGYQMLVRTLFRDMFTASSDRALADAVLARAQRVPKAIGEPLLLHLQRHDVRRLEASLACLRMPVMAIQTTTRDVAGRQTPLQAGQVTPYLQMLCAAVPHVRVEVIPDTGHFPQLEAAARTTELLQDFVASLP